MTSWAGPGGFEGCQGLHVGWAGCRGGAASLHTAPHSGPGLFMCRWARAHTQAATPAWCAPPPPGRWPAEAGAPQSGGWALDGRCARVLGFVRSTL